MQYLIDVNDLIMSLIHQSNPLAATPTKYRSDIDGLRAIAVLAVVIFHGFPNFIGSGFIGVDIFFVISGFLISNIVLESLQNGTFSFVEFYSRRIKRIFPSLALVLITCLVFGWFALLADELNQLGKHTAAGAGFISNLVLWSEAGYFDNSAETKPLLHLWSLGIEEQFYIAWPLLLWLTWRRKLNVIFIIVIGATISFVLSVKGVKVDPIASFYSPQTRFWELMVGSLLAWLSAYSINLNFCNRKNLSSVSWLRIVKKISNLSSILGLLLLIYGFWKIEKSFSFPGQWALIPVCGAALIILGGPSAWVNRTILSNKFLVWVGLVSFPLYLWHWPILSFGRILYNETPSLEFRLIAVFISFLLAWLTLKIVEKPFRFGAMRNRLKVSILCCCIFGIGIAGFIVSSSDLSTSHTYEQLLVKRKAFKQRFGFSDAWYKGKADWLFLGNSFDRTVDKLELVIVPDDRVIEETNQNIINVVKKAAEFNTKLALLVGPNKSSVYSEFLPDDIVPSKTRYINYFLNQLKQTPNLTVYDPTEDLISLKKTEGILYWMTDTHWNNKGAYLAYQGFSKLLGLPSPIVDFTNSSPRGGDLIGISKLNNFPLHQEDNWEIVWKNKLSITEQEIPDEQKSTMGSATIVINKNPLSDKYIWVVGDSFTEALKPFINASFNEIRYIGNWNKLKDLPMELTKASRKPDMIILIRVERSF